MAQGRKRRERNALVRLCETHSLDEALRGAAFADERDGGERREEVGVLDGVDKVAVLSRNWLGRREVSGR